jgi:DNA repair protein RadD
MLRNYQWELEQAVYREWNAVPGTLRNVLAVCPTGGGKTRIFAKILADHVGISVAVAHRQELVGQMSMALADAGVQHRIIAPKAVVTSIIKKHRKKHGRTFYHSTSNVIVAGIDTLIRREEDWFSRVTLWVVDEAHHVLRTNKWGKVSTLSKKAKGLGVTATPCRADGKGLGRHADGLFDVMVEGPSGRELIEMGYLSDYDVLCPIVDDIDFSQIEIGSTGDLKAPQLSKVTKQSKKLVGDIVQHYLRHARGKKGIVFAVDVEEATRIAAEFMAAGVRAQVVHGDTPDDARISIIEKFTEGALDVLVNVDLFGEGFDVPGVEVVSMGRRTLSFSLFSQQFGRSLRPVYAPGMPLDTPCQRKLAIACGPKPKALIIDHVGNVIHHRLPDRKVPWTLDAREKRASSSQVSDEFAITACTNPICLKTYERYRVSCPWCGATPTVTPRSRPEQVDGDLQLLTPEALEELRREVAKVDSPAKIPYGAAGYVAAGIQKKHLEKQRAQHELRGTIAAWGGWRKAEGLTDRDAQRMFYERFGVDILSAQALGTKEALVLKEKVDGTVKGGLV